MFLFPPLHFVNLFLLVSGFLRLKVFCKRKQFEITLIPLIHTTADVNTILNLRFIVKQKPAVFFQKILYANEPKVKSVSFNVPDLL